MRKNIRSFIVLTLLGFSMTTQNTFAAEDYKLVEYQKLILSPPTISGENVKVWNIRQNDTIRINLVEMSGELALHKHPDADHSLMVLDGDVRVQIADKIIVVHRGDFISIPANVPHKYWSLTKTAMLVSMDAPYYDPAKTIPLE
jgi:quercetin dioxygenase-like cupin family protein